MKFHNARNNPDQHLCSACGLFDGVQHQSLASQAGHCPFTTGPTGRRTAYKPLQLTICWPKTDDLTAFDHAHWYACATHADLCCVGLVLLIPVIWGRHLRDEEQIMEDGVYWELPDDDDGKTATTNGGNEARWQMDSGNHEFGWRRQLGLHYDEKRKALFNSESAPECRKGAIGRKNDYRIEIILTLWHWTDLLRTRIICCWNFMNQRRSLEITSISIIQKNL